MHASQVFERRVERKPVWYFLGAVLKIRKNNKRGLDFILFFQLFIFREDRCWIGRSFYRFGYGLSARFGFRTAARFLRAVFFGAFSSESSSLRPRPNQPLRFSSGGLFLLSDPEPWPVRVLVPV
ncbi:hypothetical protein [Allobaculum sp. Allo2]|uniref:hypothetical protein n=1 Tax=Allobaculum sp. Allo2 TaxID=2853432 RepID=UPI001F613CAD|nr:hypothetical protein [Allobaculum sp. Allo2]UNT92903.1 hypothetical protein KWG61_12685 [Allobaculum sp. Allo2]